MPNLLFLQTRLIELYITLNKNIYITNFKKSKIISVWKLKSTSKNIIAILYTLLIGYININAQFLKLAWDLKRGWARPTLA